MVLPIIGIIILFVAFVFCNFISWSLLILRVAPDWAIWVAAVANYFLGAVTWSCINWLKERVEDRRFEKDFAEEERRQKDEI